jgi:hypothetical protein
MSRKAIVVAVLSAIALAASGCSGDSDAEAESPPATTTEQVETQSPAQPIANVSRVRAGFKATFGTPPDERPWYGLITGMKMTAFEQYWVLELTTKLEDNPPNTAVRTICRAAMRYVSRDSWGKGVGAVRVIGSDGKELGGCA